ncbi:hypothetical protein, variant 2 [Phialophora macrospora]|nr:hypothetical protein, variant 2 [Phialophora macrospora]
MTFHSRPHSAKRKLTTPRPTRANSKREVPDRALWGPGSLPATSLPLKQARRVRPRSKANTGQARVHQHIKGRWASEDGTDPIQ